MSELPLPSDHSRPETTGVLGHFVDLVEQPLVLTGLAVLAALVDLISHVPTLLFVGILVLLGFHRSRKVAGKPIWVQFLLYALCSSVDSCQCGFVRSSYFSSEGHDAICR